MANRDEHDVLGAVFGAFSVTASAAAAGRNPSFPELLGGALSGVVGARIPDALEPATSPHHRGVVHSVAVLGATTFGAVPRLHRLHAAQAAAADAETDAGSKFLRQLLAGATIGCAGGFVSHLAADATTPKGLPLLG